MMRRLSLLAVSFLGTSVVEYWLPTLIRHFTGPGALARLIRPALCLVLIAAVALMPKLRSQFRMSWQWTWVLLIPLAGFAGNVIRLFLHPILLPNALAVAIVLDGLAIGLMEEFFFRGIAFLGSAESSPKATVVLSATVFALVHFTTLTTTAQVSIQTVETLVLFAFPMGIAFGIIRLATGSIAWPALMHGLIDVSGYLLMQSRQAPHLQLESLLNLPFLATAVLFFVHPAMKTERLTSRSS